MVERLVRDQEVSRVQIPAPRQLFTASIRGRLVDPYEHSFYHAQMPRVRTSDALRRCSLCGVEKPLTEFHRRRNAHQWWCKGCRRKYDAAYHARTRALRILQTRERKRRLAEWLYELKSSLACADCSGKFHHAAMTFDHLPGRAKRDDVSDLVHQGCTKLARDEISKCEVVCANCHAVRTFLRRQQRRAQVASGERGLVGAVSVILPSRRSVS